MVQMILKSFFKECYLFRVDIRSLIFGGCTVLGTSWVSLIPLAPLSFVVFFFNVTH